MSDHEEQCDCPPESIGPGPAWRFSGWDVAGIAAQTVGGVLGQVAGGLQLLAQECSAMANWSRANRDFRQRQRLDREARAEMNAALERHVFELGPTEEDSR